MASDCRNQGIVDVFQRVGSPCVLGDASIKVIDFSSAFLEGDVLHNCTKLDSVVDLGLLFRVEVYALCIAAAFDVENTAVGPYVFVVSY